jgi:hypothetical protein
MIRNPLVLRLFVEALPSMQAAGLDLNHITRYDVYCGFVRQWFGREVGRLSIDQRVALGLSAGDDMGDVGPVVDAFKLLCALLAGEMLKADVLTVSFATVAPTASSGGTGAGACDTSAVERAVWQRVQVTANAWTSGGEAALMAQFGTLSRVEQRRYGGDSAVYAKRVIDARLAFWTPPSTHLQRRAP